MSDFQADPVQPLQRQVTLLTGDEDASGVCQHCGGGMRRIWGYVDAHGAVIALYIITWMPGRTDHMVGYDLVLGRWGEGPAQGNRVAIALDMKHQDGRNDLRVVDADGRLAPQPELFDRPLSREDVFASPRAAEVLAMAHVIYASDPRLAEVREWVKA
jgi:hypothetical protein